VGSGLASRSAVADRWLDRYAAIAEVAGTVLFGTLWLVTSIPRFVRRYDRPDPSEFIPLWFDERR
jgi:hypothetical protein